MDSTLSTKQNLKVIDGANAKAKNDFDEAFLQDLKNRLSQAFDDYVKGNPIDDNISMLLEGITKEQFEQNLGLSGMTSLAAAISKHTYKVVTKGAAEKAIRQHFNGVQEFWGTIFEKDGYTYLRDGSKLHFLANFILEPEYMIVRSSETGGGGKIYENLYCYRMIVRNKNFPTPQTSTVLLCTSDFDNLKNFQKATEKVGGRIINGAPATIAEFGVHSLDKPFPLTKHGSSVFGIDVIKGRKYFVTPETVYDVETGEEVVDIVFMPEYGSNPAADFSLSNLKYDPIKWKEQIAPFFFRHIMKIHKKDIMLLIVGWLAAVPAEYVFRKLTKELAGFPHAMITGTNGGGKTMLATSLLPYLGYSQDAALLNFGGKVANIQSIDWSYNIITIFDEYRPNEWNIGERLGVERLIRESYGRTEDRKSNTSFNLRSFVRKNPMMILGQMTTSDDANSERIIQMYLDPNFMNSDSNESEEAKKYSQAFQTYQDQNFWVGFCLWIARKSNEDIIEVYRKFKKEVFEGFPDMKDRLRCFCAVVMTGLHLFEKLAEELGVSMDEVGFLSSDIKQVPTLMSTNRLVTQGETKDLLEQFLEDIVTYGMNYGKSLADLFGKNKAIRRYKTNEKSKHVWGKHEEEAIIGGRKEVILIKLDAVIGPLNEKMKKNYDEKLLAPILKSYYDAGKVNPNDAFVLAPNGYRVNQLRYSVFDAAKLNEMGFATLFELQGNLS